MSLYICNTAAVGLFGIVLSAAFCNIRWDRKNVLWMAAATAAIYLLQAVVYFGIDTTRGQYLYPVHTHLTLAIVLCVLSRQRLWPVISVLTAYLCCQLRRWLALVIVAVLGGGRPDAVHRGDGPYRSAFDPAAAGGSGGALCVPIFHRCPVPVRQHPRPVLCV